MSAVPTNQQRREAAKRKLERHQQRRIQREQRRKRTTAIVVVVVVLTVVGAIVAFAALGSSAKPADQAAAPAAGACTYGKSPQEPARPVGVPTNTDPAKQGTVALTITTNQGAVPITLDRSKAPCTVESFMSLASAKYFDDSPCHRLVTEGSLKVLQCGDPSGTGTGGPGYTIPDELPTGLAPAGGTASVYPRGAVAMANTGSPDSGGSQFFLVYADSQLPPKYTIFGTIAEPGIKVLEKIAAAGDDGSISAGGGKPKLATTIQSVTLTAP